MQQMNKVEVVAPRLQSYEFFLEKSTINLYLRNLNATDLHKVIYCCPIKIEDSTKAWLNC